MVAVMTRAKEKIDAFEAKLLLVAGCTTAKPNFTEQLIVLNISENTRKRTSQKKEDMTSKSRWQNFPPPGG